MSTNCRNCHTYILAISFFVVEKSRYYLCCVEKHEVYQFVSCTTTKYGANLPSTIEINQICLQFSKQKGGRKREETLHSTEENKKEYYIYKIAVVRWTTSAKIIYSDLLFRNSRGTTWLSFAWVDLFLIHSKTWKNPIIALDMYWRCASWKYWNICFLIENSYLVFHFYLFFSIKVYYEKIWKKYCRF